jgi:agmatine deiminase
VAKASRRSSSNTLSDPKPAHGFRMPAEWEAHAATWLAWPHHQEDWPGKFEPIPWVYAEIIRNLAKHERVELIVNNPVAARQARKILERADALSANVHFHCWPTNRVWLRDSGCIFLTPQKNSNQPDSRGRLSPHKTLATRRVLSESRRQFLR